MDTLAARWALLAPHTTVVGPDDDRTRQELLTVRRCDNIGGAAPREKPDQAVGKSGAKAERDRLTISFGDVLVAEKGWKSVWKPLDLSRANTISMKD